MRQSYKEYGDTGHLAESTAAGRDEELQSDILSHPLIKSLIAAAKAYNNLGKKNGDDELMVFIRDVLAEQPDFLLDHDIEELVYSFKPNQREAGELS